MIKQRELLLGLLLVTAIVILVVSPILIANLYACRVQYDAELAGKEVKVEWSTLNLREQAGLGADIICELSRNEVVTLTGNHRDWGVGDPKLQSHWYEGTVTLPDGSTVTGWVTKSGLRWK